MLLAATPGDAHCTCSRLRVGSGLTLCRDDDYRKYLPCPRCGPALEVLGEWGRCTRWAAVWSCAGGGRGAGCWSHSSGLKCDGPSARGFDATSSGSPSLLCVCAGSLHGDFRPPSAQNHSSSSAESGLPASWTSLITFPSESRIATTPQVTWWHFLWMALEGTVWPP